MLIASKRYLLYYRRVMYGFFFFETKLLFVIFSTVQVLNFVSIDMSVSRSSPFSYTQKTRFIELYDFPACIPSYSDVFRRKLNFYRCNKNRNVKRAMKVVR